MCPLNEAGNCIEAIEWSNGEARRLVYHQRRIEAAFRCLFPGVEPFDLAAELELRRKLCAAGRGVSGLGTDGQQFPEQGIYKLRLSYDTQLRQMEFQHYRMREVSTLKLVEIQQHSKDYKSSDRERIDNAFAQRGSCDDVLMVRDGLLTDTSYANIALYDGRKWLSPRVPLLYGTRRAYLLDHQRIELADIQVEELPRFQLLRMFNAMIDFGELEMSVKSIEGQ